MELKNKKEKWQFRKDFVNKRWSGYAQNCHPIRNRQRTWASISTTRTHRGHTQQITGEMPGLLGKEPAARPAASQWELKRTREDKGTDKCPQCLENLSQVACGFMFVIPVFERRRRRRSSEPPWATRKGLMQPGLQNKIVSKYKNLKIAKCDRTSCNSRIWKTKMGESGIQGQDTAWDPASKWMNEWIKCF